MMPAPDEPRLKRLLKAFHLSNSVTTLNHDLEAELNPLQSIAYGNPAIIELLRPHDPTAYDRNWMKKEQLARHLAKQSHITTAAAADQLDRVVNDILRRVRSGHSAFLPGLGTFHPDRKQGFQFDGKSPAGSTHDKAKKESR